MGAPDLLRHLIEAGLHLDAIGDRLSVTPSERITDDMRQAIREFKPALLALLAGNEKTLDPGLNDREEDDRRTCHECSHCSGSTPLAWRCGNHRSAGVGRELGGDLAMILQRCPGFQSTRQ